MPGVGSIVARGGASEPDAAHAAGYAAVDALVALTILASAIVFAMTAGYTTRAAALATLEARSGDELMQRLLALSPNEPGVSEGDVGAFHWRTTVHDPVRVAGDTALCREEVAVRSRDSGRRYQLATARICPASEPG